MGAELGLELTKQILELSALVFETTSSAKQTAALHKPAHDMPDEPIAA